MKTFRSNEKKIACFFLPNDLKNVCPIYCRSIKINAAKYCFKAGTVCDISVWSELKIPMRKWGARMMMLHTIAV